MLILNKMTLLYVPDEDRICMTAQPDGSGPVLFWLTQRLCRQLIPVLCTHLERATPNKSVISRDMQLSVSQRDAEWQYQSSDPVRTDGPTPTFLPSRIDYTFSGELTGLMFPVGKDERAQFRMNLQELRQFLAILHNLFVQSGWSVDVWPSWFADGHRRQN